MNYNSSGALGRCEISDERTRLGRKPGGGAKATLGNPGER